MTTNLVLQRIVGSEAKLKQVLMVAGVLTEVRSHGGAQPWLGWVPKMLKFLPSLPCLLDSNITLSPNGVTTCFQNRAEVLWIGFA